MVGVRLAPTGPLETHGIDIDERADDPVQQEPVAAPAGPLVIYPDVPPGRFADTAAAVVAAAVRPACPAVSRAPAMAVVVCRLALNIDLLVG